MPKGIGYTGGKGVTGGAKGRSRGAGVRKAVLPGKGSNQPNLARASSTAKTRGGTGKASKFGGKV